MGRATVEVRGKDKLITKFENMDARMRSEVKGAVRKNTFDMESRAKKNAPYKTGHLKRNIRADLYNRGLSGEVVSHATYSVFLEYGTRPHKITANGGALKFKAGGDTVFAKSVQHPGIAAQPFMFPAFLVTRSAFMRDLNRIMDEVVK